MNLNLQVVNFYFDSPKTGESFIAMCNPVVSTWTIYTTKAKNEPWIIREERKHQFVNQTRAKEMIAKFLEARKSGQF